MTTSVPTPSETQVTFAATLFDQWRAAGLQDVVVSPGSRSTPLVIGLEHIGLQAHVRIDERSAGFFAIGRALETQRPVAIVVTSGTAAAELLACIAEADLASVPLLVLTADRPAELHGVGAPQTIEQEDLFGPKVRGSFNLEVPEWSERSSWRNVATQAWSLASGEMQGSRPGPVHLNLQFREPLVASVQNMPTHIADSPAAVSTTSEPLKLAGARVLGVFGPGASPSDVEHARALGWAVIGDATLTSTIAYADPLLRSDAFAAHAVPDVVVRLGGAPASKVLARRLGEWGVTVVGINSRYFLSDPDRLVSSTVSHSSFREYDEASDGTYQAFWLAASALVDAHLTSSPLASTWSEIAIARTVTALSSELSLPLVVGSSMPYRDVEWWSSAREFSTFSNRGANGIDGVTSTFLGVAHDHGALGLVGDVTMLHDVSAFVEGHRQANRAVLIVLDNSGGGIFSFLSQREEMRPAEFEKFFGTPRSHDLVAVATSFGATAHSAHSIAELSTIVRTAGDGLTVVVCTVPTRDENVAHHSALNAEVVTLVEEWLA